MTGWTRRRWLHHTVATLLGGSLLSQLRAIDTPATIGLGFSLYGMKTLKTADALRTSAEIGYDGVELALMPGWPTEPKLLSADDRRDLRQQLADRGLSLMGLMENLAEPAEDAPHRSNLERLKAAAEQKQIVVSSRLGREAVVIGDGESIVAAPGVVLALNVRGEPAVGIGGVGVQGAAEPLPGAVIEGSDGLRWHGEAPPLGIDGRQFDGILAQLGAVCSEGQNDRVPSRPRGTQDTEVLQYTAGEVPPLRSGRRESEGAPRARLRTQNPGLRTGR